jgi:hypothetical protein
MSLEGQVQRSLGPASPRRICESAKVQAAPGYERNHYKVKKAHARRHVHSGGQPQKEYLDEMRFCSVLDSDGANSYRVTGTGKANPFQYFKVDLGNRRNRYAPRSSTPQYKSFSEMKRATLEVVLDRISTSSNESFSSEPFVASSMLAWYSIISYGRLLSREERTKWFWR